MASICNDKGGIKRVQFELDGLRKTLRLGKCDLPRARVIAGHIDEILTARFTGLSIRQETAVWLGSIGAILRKRLENLKLIPKGQDKVKLIDFLNSFIENRRNEVAERTTINLNQTKKKLENFYGNTRFLEDFSVKDAIDFGAKMREELAPAYAGRTIRAAKQFFKAALDEELITKNPFRNVKSGGKPNKARQFHVTREVINRVIEAAPTAEWRLIIALSRYGGLRTLSEHQALNWGDIDWDGKRFRVDSPKTGKIRWVPIFPELRPYLEECFNQAAEGAVHVIPSYREPEQNIRPQFTRIIKKAGGKPWPKLFHNLRASRQTELAKKFPLHLVCAWLGNKERIAEEHYLTIQDEDFLRAAKSGAECGAENATFPAQWQNAANTLNDEVFPQTEKGKGFTQFPANLHNSSQISQYARQESNL